VTVQEHLKNFRVLADCGFWGDIPGFLRRYEGLSEAASPLFEQIGDDRAAAGVWPDAILSYYFAAWPALHAGGRGAGNALSKCDAAIAKLGERSSEFIEYLRKKVIVFAKRHDFHEAEDFFALLQRIPESSWDDQFAAEADELQPRIPNAAIWLLERANRSGRFQEKLELWRNPPPPPRRDPHEWLAEVLPQIKDALLAGDESSAKRHLDWTFNDVYPELDAHLESMGDRLCAEGRREEAVPVYAFLTRGIHDKTSRVWQKLKALKRELIEEQLANPIAEYEVPDPLTWGKGLPIVEKLAIARRFEDADRVLSDLRNRFRYGPDESGPYIPERFEEISDIVGSRDLEIARWFLNRVVEEHQWYFSRANDPGGQVCALELIGIAKAKIADLGG
jgi:hypothetical protein